MQLLQALSATVLIVALLTSTDVAAHTKISTTTSRISPNWGDELMTDRNGASNGRSLRVDTITAEERQGHFIGKLLNKIENSVKVRWWIETRKSKNEVLKKLKLNGLRGSALTGHRNYKVYLNFEKIADDVQVNKWIRTDLTTNQVWQKLGFKHIRTVKELDSIKNTKKFNLYKQFVQEYDDDIYTSLRDTDPPAGMISRGASEAEMTARVQIMAEARRPEEYAKVALGMTVPGKPRTTLKGDALREHDEYAYFALFQGEAAEWVSKKKNK